MFKTRKPAATAPPPETGITRRRAEPVATLPPSQDLQRDERDRLERLERLEELWKPAGDTRTFTGKIGQIGRILMGVSYFLDSDPQPDNLDFLDALLTGYVDSGAADDLSIDALHLIMDEDPHLISTAYGVLAKDAQQKAEAAQGPVLIRPEPKAHDTIQPVSPPPPEGTAA